MFSDLTTFLDYFILTLIAALTVLLYYTFQANLKKRKKAQKAEPSEEYRENEDLNRAELIDEEHREAIHHRSITNRGLTMVKETLKCQPISPTDLAIEVTDTTPLSDLQNEQPALNEYNILLLGETGAGKSTTINAFANYLRYDQFEDAIDGDFIQLIPSRFTLPNPQTGKPLVIRYGQDDNECHRRGESSTQAPLGHIFQFDDKLIRIIDTPGMGDTRRADVDQQNFEQILGFLNLHKNLHGICILLKANETRKTTSFRYCLNELLTHLHKSACHNIVFCFTFSRNSFYGPGEGYDTLSAFLDDELRDVGLKLRQDNCFYIDNEAFRFLVAKKQEYPFKENQETSYRESWNISVAQTALMMEHILQLRPHNLQHTLSLNNARKLILELAEPMVRLQSKINTNIEALKAEEIRLKSSTQNKEELARSLHIQVDDLESSPLDEPTTVCTAEKCIDVIQFQGQQKINYKTKCHVNCQLTGVETNRVGHSILQRCAAMNGHLNCQVEQCNCPWQLHMHLRCEYNIVKRTIVDQNKQKEINNAQDAIDAINEALKTMELMVSEYKAEMKVIEDVSSKFAYILISHSNTPYNRFLEPYLNLLIDEEKKKFNAVPNYSRTTYDSLIVMRDTHQENVRILTEAIRNKTHDSVSIEDIGTFRKQLFQLKHCGRQFCQMTNAVQVVREQELVQHDRNTFQQQQPQQPQQSQQQSQQQTLTLTVTGSDGKTKSFFKLIWQLVHKFRKMQYEYHEISQ